MDMMKLMQQAQQMQQNMKQVESELAEKRINASAGSGAVSVTMNGKNELLAIQIAPEVINPEEQAMLQDLVMSAVNEGISKAQETAKAEMKKVTGGVNIPGLF
jgi:DNA-binding YbaB/EbfC family protein